MLLLGGKLTTLGMDKVTPQSKSKGIFFFKRRVNKTTETHDDPSNDEDVCSPQSPGTKQGSLPGSPCEPASGALCNVREQCVPPSPILQ